MITDREYRIIEPNEGDGWIFQTWWKAVNDPDRPGDVCFSTEVCADDRDMICKILNTIFIYASTRDMRDAVDDMFNRIEGR